MKYFCSVLVLFIISHSAISQSDSSITLKMGNNYFTDCEKTVVFKGQEIFDIDKSIDSKINISFIIYDENGVQLAEVKSGKMISGKSENYTLSNSAEKFSLVEKSTGRIISFVKRVYNDKEKRYEYHVSADLFLPDGYAFQCTPESSNIPMLNMMQGSNFIGSGTAITID